MTMFYVLEGSFGGSVPVVVGAFDDWDQMLDAMERGADGGEVPERYLVYRFAARNEIDFSETYPRDLWSDEDSWNTPDASRPTSFDDLRP